MQNYISYPVLQIRPWGLLAYDRIEYPTKRKDLSSPKKTTRVNGYTGKITTYSKKRLKRAISLLVASSKYKEAEHFKTGKKFKFKVNFITLTLSAPQAKFTDKQIKKQLLDVWIKHAKRNFKLNNYVWRAEKQRNGNLHFHLITDTYIHFQKLRDSWNKIQNKLGFIDQYRQKHNKTSPNSTDVHAVNNINDLAAYFSKYMSKETPEGQEIEGKIWDCSKNLKTKKNCEMLLESEAQDVWNRAYKDQEVRIKVDEKFTLLFMTTRQFNKYIKGTIRRKWEEYLELIRNGTQPLGTQLGSPQGATAQTNTPQPNCINWQQNFNAGFRQSRVF